VVALEPTQLLLELVALAGLTVSRYVGPGGASGSRSRSVRNGDFAWAAQDELAADFELVVLNRPGFPPNPIEEHIDFEEHGHWVAKRLRPGDHLCGRSYGAVISFFAAALALELRSLTVIEPPAFGSQATIPRLAAFTDRQKTYWADGPSDPRAFLSGFYALAGRHVDLPDRLPPALEQGAQALIVQRGPWEAQPPLSTLAASPYPKLVVSGGWSPIFETVCDVVEERLGAERRVYHGLATTSRTPQGSTRAF